MYASDGHEFPAGGVNDGLAGAPGRVSRINPDGQIEDLPAVGEVTLRYGERIRAITCGGGGFGNPRERAREMVFEDVEEGLISDRQACEIYGLT
jgi:N-methylhydantoinase B